MGRICYSFTVKVMILWGKGVTDLDGLTLLIADNSDAFRDALAQALCDTFKIVPCCNGKEALEAALAEKPELIVLDLMLTELDGISLLHEIRDAGIHPAVLAMTRFFNDYVQESAQELGVEYIIRKPCNPQAVASRVRDLSRRWEPSQKRCLFDREAYVVQMTQALMFSPRHQGTKFLQRAVLIFSEEPEISLTKELYPRLGRYFGGTALQVEHSLRTAIAAACKKGGSPLWDELFPVDSATNARCVSNGVVISRLAEDLRMKIAQSVQGAQNQNEACSSC